MPYDHLAKFRVDDLTVHETNHWVIAVRARQVTLGSCVILPKRPIPSLPEAGADELADLAAAARFFEQTMTGLFGAERFNYVAAMMKDPFLHFHAFPRYSGSKTFSGAEWTDTEWPKVVSFENLATDGDHLSALKAALEGYDNEA